MNTNVHLAAALSLGLMSIIFGVILGVMLFIDYHTIPVWIWGCEAILVILTYTNWRAYVPLAKQEQQIFEQTLHLEDTKEIETRNIIQLTGAQNTIFALCDDGTVWFRASYQQSEWTRIAGIPNN